MIRKIRKYYEVVEAIIHFDDSDYWLSDKTNVVNYFLDKDEAYSLADSINQGSLTDGERHVLAEAHGMSPFELDYLDDDEIPGAESWSRCWVKERRTRRNSPLGPQEIKLINEVLSSGIDLNDWDEAGRTPLSNCIAHDWPIALQLLKLGADPQKPDRDGLTPMEAAAQHDRFEVIEALLDDGSAIDLNSPAQAGLLVRTISLGSTALIQRLLGLGINPSAADQTGLTPLEAAMKRGSEEIFKWLVEAGANIQLPQAELAELVVQGVRAGMPEAVRRLIQGGASPDLADRGGVTPLQASLSSPERSKGQLISLLVAGGAEVDVRGPEGDTVLMRAVAAGDVVATSRLIEYGADPQAADLSRRRVVDYLAQPRSPQILGLLVHGGVSLDSIAFDDPELVILLAANASEAELDTVIATGTGKELLDGALLLAIRTGWYRAIGRLVSAGAHVHKPVRNRELPQALEAGFREVAHCLRVMDLHGKLQRQLVVSIVSRAPVEVVRRHLDAGASLKFRTPTVQQPLLEAIEAEADQDVIQMLLDYGADPDQITSGRRTALHLALEQADPQVRPRTFRQLLKAGANTEVHPDGQERLLIQLLNPAAGETIDRDLVLELVLHGPDVNTPAGSGETPLGLAVRHGADARVISALLNLGARIDAPNKRGQSPLMIAGRFGLDEIASQLLSAGADPDLKDRDGSDFRSLRKLRAEFVGE